MVLASEDSNSNNRWSNFVSERNNGLEFVFDNDDDDDVFLVVVVVDDVVVVAVVFIIILINRKQKEKNRINSRGFCSRKFRKRNQFSWISYNCKLSCVLCYRCIHSIYTHSKNWAGHIVITMCGVFGIPNPNNSNRATITKPGFNEKISADLFNLEHTSSAW